MNSEKVLSMAEPKTKLLNLKEFLPETRNELVYSFAAFLSTYLNNELVPEGFVLCANLALYDLERGINGYTNQQIRNSLVGYPSIIYTLLRTEISDIADAVFPTEFATEVKEYITLIEKQEETN
ncbi:MAG: hypothetical protein WDN09_02995 [bacterium]